MKLTDQEKSAIWAAIRQATTPDDRPSTAVIDEDYGGDTEKYLTVMAGYLGVPIGRARKKQATDIYNEGVVFVQQGNQDKAIIAFKKAVELKDDFTDAHYNLAVTYYALGQAKLAKTEYEIVVQLRPGDVDAINNLGTIHAQAGELEKTKQLLDQALSLRPNFTLTHRNLAAYYQTTGNSDKKTQHYNKAIELDPQIFNREPGPPLHRVDPNT